MLLRHAWILFVVIGGLGLLMTFSALLDPGMLLGKLQGVYPGTVSPGAAGDPFVAFVVRWAATALAGVNALTVFIAATAFRRGERWAGVALLYWPLMFLSHLLMYRRGPMSVVQVVWLLLTVPPLVAHLRRASPAAQAPATA